MWEFAAVSSSSSVPDWVYLLGVIITTAGGGVVAWFGARGRRRGGEDRWERRERRMRERQRRQMPITSRMARIENWREDAQPKIDAMWGEHRKDDK